MNVIITGSTGMVGQGVLLECIDDATVENILLINRNSIDMAHPKIKEILHQDFTDFKALQAVFKDFDACLPESLQMIASSLKAGLTLREALNVAAKNAPPLFAREMQEILKQNHFGIPLGEAMNSLRQKVNTSSVNISFGAMIICNRMGGKLPDMLNKIVALIEKRNKVERKLKSLTAQGRMQAYIVCAFPIIVYVGMYFFNRRWVDLLHNDLYGQIALGLAVVLEIIGIAMMAKIMKLDI